MNGSLFSFCLKNVFRGRSRALFCVLAVAVGVLSVVMLDTLGSGGQKACVEYMRSFGFSGSLLVPNTSFSHTSPLTMADEALCVSVSGIADATAFNTRYGMIRYQNETKNAVIWGVGENMNHFLGTELVWGRYFQKEDVTEGNAVIIDCETAEDYFRTTRAVGRSLQLSLDGEMMEFTVIGVVKQSISLMTSASGGQIPTFVYIPLTGLWALAGREEVSQIALLFDEDCDRAQTEKRICRMLDSKYEDSVGYSVTNMDGIVDNVGNVIALIRLLLLFAAGISLLVSGIGIMNAMLSSVKERKSEIGLCLAVGASPGQIAAEFLLEAGLLSLFGGVAGVLLGTALAAIVCSASGLYFSLSSATVLISLGIVLAIGMFFGTFPAIRASKMCPIDSLRVE